MKIVLDTNILLQSIGHSSPYRLIWTKFLAGDFELCVTSAILLEYEEILGEKTSSSVASNVISLFDEAPNVYQIHTYYNWNAITADPDDNKFFDAAVAGNVDYLVTNDAHFNIARTLTFPSVRTITGNDFLLLIKNV